MATNSAAPRGARTQSLKRRDRLDAYKRHHRAVAAGSLRKLATQPLQTLLTALVMAIALSLPASVYVVIDNLERMAEGVTYSAQMTAFVDIAAKPAAIEGLAAQLRSQPGVAEVSYVSPQQALEEFNRYSGLGNALDLLDENPLPPAFIVQPTLEVAADSARLEQLKTDIAALTLVDEVQLDMLWLERLQAILSTVQQIALLFALALGLGVILVVGNTIRLAIENRRDEIVVVKLVGGTDGFVRRPFLYTGLWYGLAGGVLAVVLVTIGVAWVNYSLSALAALYQSDFELAGLGVMTAFKLVGSGIVLGLGGAWLSVSRHLRDIEPR